MRRRISCILKRKDASFFVVRGGARDVGKRDGLECKARRSKGKIGVLLSSPRKKKRGGRRRGTARDRAQYLMLT